MDQPNSSPEPGGLELRALERQVERGSMFNQAVFQKAFQRLSLVEGLLRELTEAVCEHGLLSPADLPGAVQAEIDSDAKEAERERDGNMVLRWPAIAVREDPEEPELGEPVDCASRIHVCQAVCCKLKFALSQPEIEAGDVKWDIGHPYIIRQNETGYCCHNDADTKGCTVYDRRPGVCSRFSCRRDERIWTDFDNMVLNQEWINSHVAESDGFLLLDVSEASAETDEART
jgi:Fe-S-cluster containining protein